ncbi:MULTISPECIES: alpha/beta hydrolase [Cysteiniphilum]|uniref:Alpha/beta hydrolase n=1 Tax=Cysteiniphilum litorale TaxID=2056700 RepID=A0A8J2Z546_9GAMM|nr:MULTISPECIES: alpha/beta hydrolase fold domain-containing protein [Cysteiniphilum]GGF99840.1 alpha/beta hydrolase [Cysteiniphilum litorale]
MSTPSVQQLRERLQNISMNSPVYPFTGEITNAFNLDKQFVNMNARLYQPEGLLKETTLVFFHGGGFVAGSIDSHDNLCRMLSQKVGCKVLSIEYPLAPEHKSDMVINSCYKALCFIHRYESKLAVIGDSAGANIATVCALLDKEVNQLELQAQILINPIIDMVNPGKYLNFRDAYIHDPNDLKNTLYSPLYAQLENMPTSIIVLNNEDSLFEQGQLYSEKLQLAKVPVIAKAFNGGHLGSHLVDLDEQSQKPIAWLINTLQHTLN